MRLYIIRHADPDYPNNTITPAGHREAEVLAEWMVREKIDRIYCSPLGRALDTARYTADRYSLTPVVEEWLREHSDCLVEVDPWPRMSVFNLPGEIIRGGEAMPTHETWSLADHFNEPRFREMFEKVQMFSDEFLERHGYRREGGRYHILRSNRERLAVFCHGGFGLSWLAHLLSIPLTLMWSSFFLPASSVTTVLIEERSERWAVPRCMGLGDVSHLYAAGLPVQPAGIVALNW